MSDPAIQVVLQKCVEYGRSSIASVVEDAFIHLGRNDGMHGQVVLLKPNLISGGGPSLACTHPEFIAGVAACFLDHGAKVLLGDSPAFGNAAKVCEKHGISKTIKKMNVKVVDFSTPLQKQLAGGVTVTLAREALECDLFVGLPKVKAHNQLYVTLAVKNIFGIVKGVNKALLHMVHGSTHHGFAAIILDLLDLLPPQMHLADGIVAMHRSGPLDGEQLPLSCIAVATSAVAMDTALLTALELDPRRSPLWQVAAARKLAGSDPNCIDYPVLLPEDFFDSGFLAPAGLNPIRFNPLRFIRGLMKRAMLKVHS
ncbi:MAG: DUF362 domain-containing protein [Proteobacteria bacterium]|nr:DUF362 domain-containing protein [Pseudomonadota bacterium]